MTKGAELIQVQDVDVLFVCPPFHDCKSEYPPLGIGHMAAVLEQVNLGVQILDLGVHDWDDWKQYLSERLDRVCPRWVGISALTSQIIISLDLARYIKERYPETKVVLGGSHPTVCPTTVLSHPSVDYVIRGEGEYIFQELIQGKELATIDGLSYKHNGRFIHNKQRQLIDNLDSMPFPARHLFDLEKYTWYPEMSLISSRGCPFGCYFCYKGLFGPKYRTRSPQNIIDEMVFLNKKYGVSQFYFYDDLFTIDKKRVLDFCKMLQEQKLNFKWRCCSRIDTLDKERIEAMAASGCNRIHFGIEAGDPVLLKKVKGLQVEKVKEIVKMVREAGIAIKCYYIIGHPWDTKQTIESTIQLARELGSADAQFSIATPLPSTGLWDEAEALGVIKERSNVDWSKLFVRGDMMKPVMRTKTVSSEDLLKYYKKAVRRVYLDKLIYTLKRPKELVRIIRERGIVLPVWAFYRKVIQVS